MCYKQETQEKNERKLQEKFNADNTPLFIQKYFVNIESKAGAINYYIAIKDLFGWLMENNVIDRTSIANITPNDFYDVEAEDITLYLKQKEASGISPTTLNTRKNIFSSFWRYLKRTKKCPVTENIIEDVAYKGIASNNNLIKKLPTEEQLKNMEEKIKSKNDEFVRIRNLSILKVLKGTGLREAELAGLDLSDLFLDADMPYIKIIGKGKYREQEARMVYLTGDAAKAIKEWLEYRSYLEKILYFYDTEAVFLNKNGKRLNEENIKAIFKNYGEGITCHMLRHWFATVMSNAGNAVFAQQQLGHSSISTTVNNYANGAYGMKEILARM